MSKITFVIPVYNAAKYLSQTLDSIYHSSEQSFTVLICNDGSTDNTCEIIEQYQKTHSNIKLIHNRTNRGAGYTRAKMMRLVTTDFVAFCDADDIVHPDRLRKQLEYFDVHPDISVLGSHIRVFNGDSMDNNRFILKSPEHDIDIKTVLLYSATMFTSSVMMRMKDIRKSSVEFDVTRRVAEDYDYWVSLAPFVKFANIQEPLVCYRRHRAQVTNRNNNWTEQMSCHIASSQKMLAHYGVNIGFEAVRVLCFPQHTPPTTVARNIKQELTCLMRGISHANFGITVSLLQQRIITHRILPYVQLLPSIITVIRAYRPDTQTSLSLLSILKFYAVVMLMPLCISRTIRSMWWRLRHRILYKVM